MEITNPLLNPLLERYVRETAPLLIPHINILRRVRAALNNGRAEFVAQYRALVEQEEQHPARWRTRGSELANQMTVVWADSLADHTLPDALQRGATWSAELYADGLDFADQYVLWKQYRRALLPTLLREFAAGPELALAFEALDAQERAVMGLVGVMGIIGAREQLTQGVHLRSVGRLTGGLAHAMNNTMAVIVGRAQIVEEQLTNEDLRQELRSIQRVARAGAESFRQLHQFATEHDGHAPERVDVNLIVNQVIQLTRFRWRDDAEASGISIDIVKDLDVTPQIWAQSALLRDALVELILNSVEAMPLGGIVTLRTERADDKVVILVIDQGEGMDETTRTRALEPFFTTKAVGHVGLGLATVAEIVRQLNGAMELESERGQGTTVRIALPIATGPATPTERQQARMARWASILVVDDEPQIRDVAARTFHLRGFRVVAADSGADALRVFQEKGPFEVVITDLGMPGLNGFELARALKDLHPQTIVILMTGWAAEIDPVKMRESGIDRAISKPFDVDQVVQLIGEAFAIQEKK
ncbi:MAG: Sensor histidine kinase RcsC [Anaerolineae bacterium]|nr:Sensor histidine kinase RcsC [Anaerolineae bacterium]